MSIDEPTPGPDATPTSEYDTTRVHDLLNQAEAEYHQIFDGHVANEVDRFGKFLSTVRMIVDQSADMAPKE